MWFGRNHDEDCWDVERVSHLWEGLCLSNIKCTLSLDSRLDFLDFYVCKISQFLDSKILQRLFILGWFFWYFEIRILNGSVLVLFDFDLREASAHGVSFFVLKLLI